MEFPVRFTSQMKKLLGENYPAYRDSFSSLPEKGIRINELKIGVEEFSELWQKTEHEQLVRIPWIHNGFFLPKDSRASRSPLYQAGLFYLQEPSAMVPAEYLPVEENDYVLDLCAAPGGKSTELLAKLHGTGLLYSNDISVSRARALARNLEKSGAVNAFVTVSSPDEMAVRFPSFFDRILVDAPCSGEGMFRTQPGMMNHWEQEGPEYYAPLQARILDKAAEMLRPGGTLMYSTCTFSPKEDEFQVESFLKNHPDFQPEEIPEREGFSHLPAPGGGAFPYVRLYPHRIRGEGQFAALLKKAGASVPHRPAKARYWKKGTETYLLPAGHLPAAGVHYLMTGLHVSTEKRNRTERTQAFAMAQDGRSVKETLSLSPDDGRLLRYLRGETIELTEKEIRDMKEGAEVLVCIGPYPLGFGKRAGVRLKNRRDKGWRILF